MKTYRLVHVIDDQEAMHRSLRFTLMTSGFSVQTWPSGCALIERSPTIAPGCIILDMGAPEMDGLLVQQALRERGTAFPIVMLTASSDLALAVRALKAGAVRVIQKPFDSAVLITALGAAFDQIDRPDANDARTAEARTALRRLSSEERHVLESLMRDLTNEQIAHDMSASLRTIEQYRANIIVKLRVSDLFGALTVPIMAGQGDAS